MNDLLASHLSHFYLLLPTPIVCLTLAVIVSLLSFIAKASQVSHYINAPSVAGRGYFASWICAITTPFVSHKLIENGYYRYRKQLFKMPRPFDELLLVTNSHLEEMLSVPEDVFSFYMAVDDLTQSQWVFGPQVLGNPFHGHLLATKLQRQLQNLFPLLNEEIIRFCDKELNQSVTDVHVYPFVLRAVSRMSNRIFGSLTAENEDALVKLSMDFTVEVVKASYILFLFPDNLKPYALKYLTRIPRYIDDGIELLRPSIQQRREAPHDDMLGWIISSAPPEEQNDRSITIRVMHLIFASLHTTVMTFSHALYHIAARPQYIEPLRDEIAGIVNHDGWSKESISKMCKLDSFLQECQRYSPIGAIIMIRKCLQTYQFADGTTAPPGSTLAVPLSAIHMDPANYENPTEFDGFRFLDPEGRNSMLLSNNKYLTFGRGKHSCVRLLPGRYFAVLELKSLMAHLVLSYNIKLTKPENGRPADEWYGTNRVPNTSAHLLFEKRDVYDTDIVS